MSHQVTIQDIATIYETTICSSEAANGERKQLRHQTHILTDGTTLNYFKVYVGKECEFRGESVERAIFNYNQH